MSWLRVAIAHSVWSQQLLTQQQTEHFCNCDAFNTSYVVNRNINHWLKTPRKWCQKLVCVIQRLNVSTFDTQDHMCHVSKHFCFCQKLLLSKYSKWERFKSVLRHQFEKARSDSRVVNDSLLAILLAQVRILLASVIFALCQQVFISFFFSCTVDAFNNCNNFLNRGAKVCDAYRLHWNQHMLNRQHRALIACCTSYPWCPTCMKVGKSSGGVQ